jgi:small subunit ribosomal protein S19e
MVTIFDVDANELIEVAKERLKKFEELRPPEWAKFVKTAPYKERPPQQDDWWYIRAAAILRYLYKIGRPIGVSRLRKKYGGSAKVGYMPDNFGHVSQIPQIFTGFELDNVVMWRGFDIDEEAGELELT